MEAFADLVGVVDGLEVKVPTGAGLERRVDQSLELTLPDIASLSVVVGAAGDLTGTELQAAEGQLGDLLRAGGATDLADAERRHKAREDGDGAAARAEVVPSWWSNQRRSGLRINAGIGAGRRLPLAPPAS